MRIRLHVEDFEIEIGGSDRHTPFGHAVGAALAPAVMWWIERNQKRLWPTPPATPTDPDASGDETRQTVDGAAAPANGAAAAAEV